MISFPREFLWGTATAAYQVEGQNSNCEWWDWEQQPGRIHGGDSARVACDWWGGRYREDFDRAAELGQNAHRLSVEWSRIEPQPGRWDDAPLEKYRAMLTALRERGMEPFVTLVHFTHPRWFLASGGWLQPNAPELFERYAVHVVQSLGDLCRYWITINEPNLYVILNYLWKDRPPGAQSLRQALKVARNLIAAHVRGYHAIHSVQKAAQVSVAFHWRWITPENPRSGLDQFAARLSDHMTNRMYLRPLVDGIMPFPVGRGEKITGARGALDFVALNHYFRDRVTFDPARPGSLFVRQTPVNWLKGTEYENFELVGDISPSSLGSVLDEFRALNIPIYITENGVFDIGNNVQSAYLISHLSALGRAREKGHDVRGYFWWTLVDNFEWEQGYWLRFGLYHLDLATQVRTRRPVAELYAQVVRESGIREELVEQYGWENGVRRAG